MSRPGTTPPSPSISEPPPKLFKADAPFGARILPPPPPSRLSISESSVASTRPSIASSSDASIAASQALHRPHSISSADSGYYTNQPVPTPEVPKPRSQSYPNNLAHVTTKLYTVSRPSVDHPKQVIELSEEQKQLPPSQPIARSACVPCRKKKVGCDLRQPGNVAEPPCRRCRADSQHCFFSAPTLSQNTADPPPPALSATGQALPSLRDLACPHCSCVFLRDDDLRTHLRSQCPEKHYVCSTCHARFKRLNDLDRHNRIHTGERPHKCDICRRTFSRATTLSRHKQGPEGCAGRRADIGRRRLGSFQGPAPDGHAEGVTVEDLLNTDHAASEANVSVGSGGSIRGVSVDRLSNADVQASAMPEHSADNVDLGAETHRHSVGTSDTHTHVGSAMATGPGDSNFTFTHGESASSNGHAVHPHRPSEIGPLFSDEHHMAAGSAGPAIVPGPGLSTSRDVNNVFALGPAADPQYSATRETVFHGAQPASETSLMQPGKETMSSSHVPTERSAAYLDGQVRAQHPASSLGS
ncbi:MAG: hypothetical protein Q9159_006392 [Coniocarpon cinnabarinum]